jgi:protocatechuate 3,4-dioxygenase beta subunit
MDHDDRQIGRILSRREVLMLIGASAATLLMGCGSMGSGATPETSTGSVPSAAPSPPTTLQPSPSPAATATQGALALPVTPAPVTTPVRIPVPVCVVRPEQTEGPYFVDTRLNRADIRSDPISGIVKDGAPLTLTFVVSRIGNDGCAPLRDAMVDIWHCDAQGFYSDVRDPRRDTTGEQWLRGYQMTDAGGIAAFTTIYPGWYPGRAVHIHFKIRTATAAGQVYDFTSQLYFDDAVSDAVFAQAPYAARGNRTTRNQNDGIFRRNGEQLVLALTPTDQGYAATFEIGLQL